MNLYGITNCDTVKEARAWLAQRGVSHRFVDFKKVPPTRDQLAAWCAARINAAQPARHDVKKLERKRSACVTHQRPSR
jgi:arsenate reductase-like glutaredoxin family protein